VVVLLIRNRAIEGNGQMGGGDLGAVMERVTKLLALSTSSNEHEAASAAAKAQQLMFRHNLSLAQVQAGPEDARDAYTERVIDLGALQSWRRTLIHVLAEHNFCKALAFVGTPRVAIIGEPHNIALVEQLYAYLLRELLRLADVAWQRAKRRSRDSARQWKHGFQHGAVEVIAERLAEQREEDAAADEASRALVLRKDAGVADALRRQYPDATTDQRRATVSVAGWQAGRQAAETVSIGVAAEASDR
jgi:hypothetical protein